MQIGKITIGKIKNVRKSGNEENVYFADVEISFDEGFPFETVFYCARSDDYAMIGRGIYQQIIEGNIEGGITELLPNVNSETRQPQ